MPIKLERAVVYHDKFDIPFKAVVLSETNGDIQLKFASEKLLGGFGIGDEIFVKNHNEDSVKSLLCKIMQIDSKGKTASAQIINSSLKKDSRECERFFVSYPAKLKLDKVNLDYGILIRDLSQTGISFLSDKKIPQNKKFYINMDIGEEEICLGVDNIRMKKRRNRFEYGVIIEESYNSDIFAYNDFLNIIREEQEKALLELKE